MTLAKLQSHNEEETTFHPRFGRQRCLTCSSLMRRVVVVVVATDKKRTRRRRGKMENNKIFVSFRFVQTVRVGKRENERGKERGSFCGGDENVCFDCRMC